MIVKLSQGQGNFFHDDLEQKKIIYFIQRVLWFKFDHVCLFKKSLHGWKQSLRQWYKRFDTFLIGHGYSKLT